MFAGDAPDLSIGKQQIEPQHMITKTAVMFVILAVYIIGDGATNRDETGAGTDRRQPAFGQEAPEQIMECDAGTANDFTIILIETDNPG